MEPEENISPSQEGLTEVELLRAEIVQMREALTQYDERLRNKRDKKKNAPKKPKNNDKKDTLGTSRGIETMFRTSYRVHMDLSSLADAKANMMISINGLIMSIVLASIGPGIDTNPWLLIPTLALLITCMLAIVYSVRAARPRVSTKKITLAEVRENIANILFFGIFSNMEEDDFVTGMHELMRNTDQLYTNMIRDIYGLGKVLNTKFALLRVAYTLFMFGIVISILLYIGFFIYGASLNTTTGIL